MARWLMTHSRLRLATSNSFEDMLKSRSDSRTASIPIATTVATMPVVNTPVRK